MSLFSSEPKKKSFNWGDAALGFFGGPEATRSIQSRRANEAELEREEQERFGRTMQEMGIRSGLEQEGLPSHVIDSLMADPKRASEFMMEKYKTRQSGVEGMSLYDGTTGKSKMTPGYRGGAYVGDWDGQSKPNIIDEKVEQVTPQDGGMYPVGGFSGKYMGAGPAPGEPPSAPKKTLFKPGQTYNGMTFKGGDDTDPNNWQKGGAAPSNGPGRFPRPY